MDCKIETRFSLADFLKPEDLFEYGMVPQFMARFDNVVLLRELDVAVLKVNRSDGLEVRGSHGVVLQADATLQAEADASWDSGDAHVFTPSSRSTGRVLSS